MNLSQISLNDILIAIISFGIGTLLGFFTGYFTRSYFGQKLDGKNGSLLVLLVVTFIWAVSMIVDIASPTYETSPLLHGLMGAIVGFFYKPMKIYEINKK